MSDDRYALTLPDFNLARVVPAATFPKSGQKWSSFIGPGWFQGVSRNEVTWGTVCSLSISFFILYKYRSDPRWLHGAKDRGRHWCNYAWGSMLRTVRSISLAVSRAGIIWRRCVSDNHKWRRLEDGLRCQLLAKRRFRAFRSPRVHFEWKPRSSVFFVLTFLWPMVGSRVHEVVCSNCVSFWNVLLLLFQAPSTIRTI